MKIEAHLNENKDLLVTLSFPGQEIEDVCVHAQKDWIADKDFDHMARIRSDIENHVGRILRDEEWSDIEAAAKKAKVTDGIDQEAMAAKQPAEPTDE